MGFFGKKKEKKPAVIANPRRYGSHATSAPVKPKPVETAKKPVKVKSRRKSLMETDNSSATHSLSHTEHEEIKMDSEVEEAAARKSRPSLAGGRPSLAGDKRGSLTRMKRPSLRALELEPDYEFGASFYKKLTDSAQGKHFKEVYKLGPKLGSGAFSTVREGFRKDYDPSKYAEDDRDHPPSYAMKIVRKENLTPLDEGALMDEIEILKEVGQFKHIIRLYDVFEEQKFYYLVTEKMAGGELYDRIVMKEHYNEKEARDVSETLIAALGYCHVRKIVHRDLKPANLLMMDPMDETTIKIADFGFAKRVRSPKSLSTKCGTPQYVAPEVLSGKLYDTQADMWSIGIIIYTVLAGHPPFEDDNLRKLVKLIKQGEVSFDEKVWKNHSAMCKEFVSNLLTVDPDHRFDARQALMSDWIHAKDDVLEEINLEDNLKAFKKFNGKRKFRAAVKAVVATQKLQHLVDMSNEGILLAASNRKNANEPHIASLEDSDDDFSDDESL